MSGRVDLEKVFVILSNLRALLNGAGIVRWKLIAKWIRVSFSQSLFLGRGVRDAGM